MPSARMNARPSRSIFRSHATRGASATLFALALVFFRRIHAAEREAVRATRFNARDFCEQTSTRELEPWNNHKKVLSFSYLRPLARAKKQTFLGSSMASCENAKDAKLYYPDWVVHIYAIGLDIKTEGVLLRQSNVELVRCELTLPLNSSSSRKMLTRFLVYDDPKVSVAVVRDADSRLSPRELFAVNAWISSDFRFHVMRDHASHDVAVLGGMFGMKRGALRRRVDVATDHASFDRKPNPHQGRSRRRSSFFDEVRLAQSKTFLFRARRERQALFEIRIREVSRLSYGSEANRRNSTSVRRSRASHARSSARSYVCAITCAIDG